MKITHTHSRSLVAGLGLGAALLLAPIAGAVTIQAVADPGGPINVNDTFDVDFSVSGWNSGDGEVDAITFRVVWDPTMFDYVSSSLVSDGTEFLAESNQGAGYTLSDDTSAAFESLGLFLMGVSDSGDATAGSIGGGDGSGTIGTITFKALDLGTGSITTSAPGGDPDETFADTSLNGIAESGITGGITFGSDSMTVIPEPTGSLLAFLGGTLLLFRRRRPSA